MAYKYAVGYRSEIPSLFKIGHVVWAVLSADGGWI
jgi:hypothetical protein